MRKALRVACLIAACTSCTPEPPLSRAVDSAYSLSSRVVSPAAVNAYLARHLGFTSEGGELRCAYVPLGQSEDRIFINTECREFVHAGDSATEASGRGGPVALRLRIEHDTVVIASHEVPQDGGGYSASVRRIFPPQMAERIFSEGLPDTLRNHLRAGAIGRLNR